MFFLRTPPAPEGQHAAWRWAPALPCPALPMVPCLPCPALPCPALPCPALPCPALPCPACPPLLRLLPTRPLCLAPLHVNLAGPLIVAAPQICDHVSLVPGEDPAFAAESAAGSQLTPELAAQLIELLKASGPSGFLEARQAG